jgi:hypothetical protein
MRDDLWIKGLVVGIILLFVGTSVLPSISGNQGKTTKNGQDSPKTLGLTGDLIGYWKFDEGSGSIAHDSSGNGLNGNINGSTQWTTGKNGSALEITGTGFVGDISSSYDDSITTAFTVAAWVKWYGPPAYPHHNLIFDGRGSYDNGFVFYINMFSGKLEFNLNQPGSVCQSISTIPIGSWTHVAVVFNDSSDVCRFYINGNLDNTVTTTFTYYNSDFVPAAIGNSLWAPGDGNWAPFTGILDEVYLYKKALSTHEIERLAGVVSVNHNPNTPSTPSGKKLGKINVDYAYTTKTTDVDEDPLYYLWDWGDGTTSGWLGPYGSNVTADAIYKWTTKGSHKIKVKAMDLFGAESPWSDPLPITMPYSYNSRLPFLELLFQRFPNAFPILRHLVGY